MPAASSRAGPPRRVSRHVDRRELEAHLHAVLGRAGEVVDDHPVARLDEEHTAAMSHGVGQATICVVLGVGEVERIGGHPAAQPSTWPRAPGERSGGLGLIRAVDQHRAVCPGPSEEFAPCGLRRVAVRSGIHQVRLPERGRLDAEQVGVAMAARQLPATPHHVEPLRRGAGDD